MNNVLKDMKIKYHGMTKKTKNLENSLSKILVYL